MSAMCLIGSYFLSVGGGWLIAGLVLFLMAKSFRPIDTDRNPFRLRALWVGGVERAIATTLVIWAPPMLPAYIGGWTLLKYAAHWQRGTDAAAVRGSLMFLVGNAVSFAAAIGAGLVINPGAVEVWATPN